MTETQGICIICFQHDDDDALKNGSAQTNLKIKEYAYAWNEIGERKDLFDRIKEVNFSILQQFHRNCYISLTNKSYLNKCSEKYKFKCRQDEPLSKKSKTVDIDLCIFCQQLIIGEKPSKITTNEMSAKILMIKDLTASDEIVANLASVSTDQDSLSQGLKYHKNCFQREYDRIKFTNKSDSIDNENANLSDSEIVIFVKEQLLNTGRTMDMNQIEEQYKVLLKKNGLSIDTGKNYRRYIKQILENDTEIGCKIEFLNSPRKPAVVATKETIQQIVCDVHYKKPITDMDHLLTASKIIREELSNRHEWKFQGDFASFVRPAKLDQLMQWIIAGNYAHAELNHKRRDEVLALSRRSCEYVYSNFKSERVIKYPSLNRGFEKKVITPLIVGTSLLSYKNNRSALEINLLFQLGLGISYDKLERFITGIAMSVIKEGERNGLGVFLPPFVVKNNRPIFAADNIDLGSDSHSFHGADLMIIQHVPESTEDELLVTNAKLFSEEKLRTLPCSVTIDVEEVELLVATDIPMAVPKMENSINVCSQVVNDTLTWLLLTSDSITNEMKAIPPSWSAYNSLICRKKPTLSKMNIVPPLYYKSPTNDYILLDILKRAQNISTLIIGDGKRTIISLDGDLFKRAIQIPNYKDRWIIRLGSLHQIIAALKTLGKYVEDSGIDMALELSGIYGTATIRQIIEGRHIYRGIEAHTIILIALFHLLFQVAFTDEEQSEVWATLNKVTFTNNTEIQSQIQNLQSWLNNKGTLKILHVDSNQTDMAKFLKSYMKQVINLLSFIAGTRNRDWKLHLATTDDMGKYFHAHDQSNYAKWAALYLADMLELEKTDPETWDFFMKGNFTVTKSGIPFTSIDPDHAMEHEQRKLKAKAGFTGITQNKTTLEKFCLTIPMLAIITEDFKTYSGIHSSKPSSLHHELVGDEFKKRLSKAEALSKVLQKEGNPFLFEQLCNLVNFTVPNENIQKDIINRDKNGQEAFEIFWKERLAENSKVSFWSPLKRNNYKYFSCTEIVAKSSESVKNTTAKEERQLYTRLMLVSRSRPELNLRKAIGEYEFNNIPSSAFLPDGSMIMQDYEKDKDKLMIEMKKLPEGKYHHQELSFNNSVIIVDGMRLVYEIKKLDKIKTAKDFAEIFIVNLSKIANNFNEIRVMFKTYTASTVTEVTRGMQHKLKKIPIHFKVNDNTPINKLDQFLSHINTKFELTKYLGDKIMNQYERSDTKVLVSYHQKFTANCAFQEDVKTTDMQLGEHSLEEVSQLILLNCIEVAKSGEIRKLTVYASDPDVLVLLIGFYKSIPPHTEILGLNEEVTQVGDLYFRLGQDLSDALIGWYIFKGTAVTGSFFGKTVKKQFDSLLAADKNILEAFSAFGSNEIIPEFIIPQVERFICLLYGKSSGKIADLRYSMTLDGKESRQLPPTLGTLIPHMHRAYHLSLIWKSSIIPFNEKYCPSKFYWEFGLDNKVHPVMCIKPCAPRELLELKKCACKAVKNRCSTLSCNCVKNGLMCTDVCKCDVNCSGECTNHLEKDYILDEDEIDSLEMN